MNKIIKENIMELNSQINEARLNESYCDVSIKVGETLFRCHRVVLGSASKYFDAMFRGTFKESKSEDVELKETEVATFESVLQFIYTGRVVLSESNVLTMIRASEFYNLPGLRKLCRQFINEKMKLNELIEDVLEIFAFSRGTAVVDDKDDFVISLSAYIRKHLYYFLNTASFLTIGLNNLMMILEQSVPSSNENVVVQAIIRWVQQSIHSQEEKEALLSSSLFREVHFENISPEYTKLIVKQFLKEHAVPKQNGNDEKHMTEGMNEDILNAELSADAAIDEISTLDLSTGQSLYVYIKSPQKVTNIYTLQKCYFNCCEWMFLCRANDDSDVARITPLNDRLYCLNYHSSSVQTFSVSSSVSLFAKLQLKVPPLVVSRFDVCGMNNCLYMYNKDTLSNVVRSVQDSEFSDELISRGVYSYNCEIDKWISLPPLMQKVSNACMTCDYQKGLVYLIGGINPTQQGLSGYVQVYDPRTKAWMAFPRTEDTYENGACCFDDVNCDIIVSGGKLLPKHPEYYRAADGEWERYDEEMNTVKNSHHIICHGEEIWAFGDYLTNSSVEVYDGVWSNIDSLKMAVENKEVSSSDKNSPTQHIVLDCVTFKPFGL